MKKFEIPEKYKSSIITRIKNNRKLEDPRKQNFEPTELDFGPVRFNIARHFGFCYGVENAIEIAYKTIDANPGKRIYLLSEMIHNPGVNDDLLSRGVQFLMDTKGNQLVEWDKLKPDDVVIIPAFGTTLEIEKKLNELGIDPYKYNTTCPFVEKVWNRAASLGKEDYTIVIHGKHDHEETRATFSHSRSNSPAVVVRDIEETKFLAKIISEEIDGNMFYEFFKSRYSGGFDVKKNLNKIGVVNQTTMLASETQNIADYLKLTMVKKYGGEKIKDHFADTRDTLCYATNDNQNATLGLLKKEADFAIVVGGYNSSNTTHLVELLEKKFETYFISSADKIISKSEINHFDIHAKKEKTSYNFIPDKKKVDIVVTSGASCPDAVVDDVLNKILKYFGNHKAISKVFQTEP
ncbi:MAG: 4-hydroxy-3-methylbut-2-enyl diphosphate reductase [Melioribacteraceae bacterium]|nr:4-hydroxy-3-methylbut-2-enyl diphosphate reductase [Melioribacteraceae bacterium]